MTLKSFLSLLTTVFLTSAATAVGPTTSAPASSTAISPITVATKIETTAPQAIVVDHHTGKVLLEKNADELMYPSSMTKIMTAYMIFERLKNGTLTLDTLLPVSEKAWKMQGSKMFISVNSNVSVSDLLHGVIIVSGNDACTALAEGVSGSEEVFADEMTQRARQLGAVNTTFKNASGWPDPEHMSTARDLSIIAQHVINDFSEHYSLFGEKEYTYNNITQQNRNPLLNTNLGCDGLKTGSTDIGKYGLVASAKEVDTEGNEKRYTLVINGLANQKERAQEAVKLMTWALKNFTTVTVCKAGHAVETAPVWLGVEEKIALTVAKDCRVTIPQLAKKDLKIDIQYQGPLNAPLAKGQQVGKIIITGPTINTPIEVPLITAEAVEKAGFFKRIMSSLSYLIWGKA